MSVSGDPAARSIHCGNVTVNCNEEKTVDVAVMPACSTVYAQEEAPVQAVPAPGVLPPVTAPTSEAADPYGSAASLFYDEPGEEVNGATQ